MRKFLLAAGLLAAYLLPVEAAGQSLREKCIGDRCGIYSLSGKRIGTTERVGERLVIRGPDYKVKAKVSERGNGSYRIEKPRR
jgi:hypothetical protein